MLPQSTATLANSPWQLILGLLLAAGGVFLIGTALTVTASQATSPAPSSTQGEARAAVVRSARTAWLSDRAWPRPLIGRLSTSADSDVDNRVGRRLMPDGETTVRELTVETEQDQLVTIQRRAHMQNLLVVSEDEPRHGHEDRKCPACDVSSDRSDASVD